jgi:NAD(P)-dependent dehydrogenase (short-subunit alcohol dehydrogenase family)
MGILEECFIKKNIVIGGIGSGQGTSTARLLNKFGAKVFALSRTGDLPTLKDSNGIEVIKCDLTNQREVKESINYIVEQNGKIDGILNNVGIWEGSNEKMVAPQILQKFLSANLLSQYILIYESVNFMNRKSSIVNIGASMALFSKNNAGYTISKYGIQEMTRVLASDFIGREIRVNSVMPGTVSKEDTFEKIFPFNFHSHGSMDPLEISYVSAFLLSPLSTGINGVSMAVDEGIGL